MTCLYIELEFLYLWTMSFQFIQDITNMGTGQGWIYLIHDHVITTEMKRFEMRPYATRNDVPYPDQMIIYDPILGGEREMCELGAVLQQLKDLMKHVDTRRITMNSEMYGTDGGLVMV